MSVGDDFRRVMMRCILGSFRLLSFTNQKLTFVSSSHVVRHIYFLFVVLCSTKQKKLLKFIEHKLGYRKQLNRIRYKNKWRHLQQIQRRAKENKQNTIVYNLKYVKMSVCIKCATSTRYQWFFFFAFVNCVSAYLVAVYQKYKNNWFKVKSWRLLDSLIFRPMSGMRMWFMFVICKVCGTYSDPKKYVYIWCYLYLSETPQNY